MKKSNKSNKSNKLVNMAIVSSALLTTNVISFAENTNSSTSVDMQLGIVRNDGGKSADLNIYNASAANSFELRLKLEGDVELKSIEFASFIKENATANYDYNPDTKTIEIVVTSTVDLVKGGTLNIGKIVVEGNDNVKYNVVDNSTENKHAIVMVTPTYDEVYDNNLEEVGDTTITIGDASKVEDEEENPNETPQEPSIPDENPDVPPTTPPSEDGDKPQTPPVQEEQKPQTPPSQEEQNPQTPPTQDGDKNETTKDIEVTTGKDGYKVVTPKTKKALDSVIAEILKADSKAKIVEIKEEGNYYVYKVKYKKVSKDNSAYDYITVKVSKDVSSKKELPGIEVEKTNTNTNTNTNTGTNNNTNTGTNNNNSTTERPQTGDNSLSTIMYSAMAMVASVIGLVYVNKKQTQEVKIDRDTYRRKND